MSLLYYIILNYIILYYICFTLSIIDGDDEDGTGMVGAK